MASNPPGAGTKTFSINLPESTVNALDTLAERLGKSRNKLISQIVTDALAGGGVAQMLADESARLAAAAHEWPEAITNRRRRLLDADADADADAEI